jgi:hypothetical protein
LIKTEPNRKWTPLMLTFEIDDSSQELKTNTIDDKP